MGQGVAEYYCVGAATLFQLVVAIWHRNSVFLGCMHIWCSGRIESVPGAQCRTGGDVPVELERLPCLDVRALVRATQQPQTGMPDSCGYQVRAWQAAIAG